MFEANLISLKPVEGIDADELFPLLHGSTVTDTICWDGPSSLAELRSGLAERETQVRSGERHQWTIVERATGKKIGSIDLRPYASGAFRGDMGLWVGVPFHGRGFGSEAVSLVVRYGFEKLSMEKIESAIFVGNVASRRIFEKAGFQLEGTLRRAVRKRGKLLDEWLMGIVSDSP